MKKSSKFSLKKSSPDISLQDENEASYKFSKKKLLHVANLGLALKGLILNPFAATSRYTRFEKSFLLMRHAGIVPNVKKSCFWRGELDNQVCFFFTDVIMPSFIHI